MVRRKPGEPALAAASEQEAAGNTMSDTSTRFLTLVLGCVVLLSSAVSDRDHRPPAGARTAIELITDSRSRGAPKSSRSQMKMDAIPKHGVDCSGKFHTTTGEAQRVSIARTASNPHLCGDQDAAET
jgi:hypothetical protein